MPTTPSYSSLIAAEAAWVRNSKTNATGAIHGYSNIQPYFGHLAALGTVLDADSLLSVRNWVDWHISKLDLPDDDGRYGTIDAYAKVGEAVEGEADADDSAASSFILTCQALAQNGLFADRDYVRTKRHHIELAGSVLVSLQQTDGLTWNSETSKVKYLEDNVESWAGFKALAWLSTNCFRDEAAATYWEAKATLCSGGIETVLWNGTAGRYYWAKTNAGTLSMLDRKAQLSTFATNVITLTVPSAANNFTDGQLIQLDNDLNGVSPKAGFLTIQSRDAIAGTLTCVEDIATGVPTVANGDAVFVYQSFYPAAQSQLWPIIFGLIDPAGSRAIAMWAIFQSWFPTWPQDGFLGSGFPQCVVGYAAAVMGSRSDAAQFAERIYQEYASDHLDSTYFPAEAGWYIRLLNALQT